MSKGFPSTLQGQPVPQDTSRAIQQLLWGAQVQGFFISSRTKVHVSMLDCFALLAGPTSPFLEARFLLQLQAQPAVWPRAASGRTLRGDCRCAGTRSRCAHPRGQQLDGGAMRRITEGRDGRPEVNLMYPPPIVFDLNKVDLASTGEGFGLSGLKASTPNDPTHRQAAVLGSTCLHPRGSSRQPYRKGSLSFSGRQQVQVLQPPWLSRRHKSAWEAAWSTSSS